jgi:hypothetical protein
VSGGGGPLGHGGRRRACNARRAAGHAARGRCGTVIREPWSKFHVRGSGPVSMECATPAARTHRLSPPPTPRRVPAAQAVPRARPGGQEDPGVQGAVHSERQHMVGRRGAAASRPAEAPRVAARPRLQAASNRAVLCPAALCTASFPSNYAFGQLPFRRGFIALCGWILVGMAVAAYRRGDGPRRRQEARYGALAMT